MGSSAGHGDGGAAGMKGKAIANRGTIEDCNRDGQGEAPQGCWEGKGRHSRAAGRGERGVGRP